MRVTGESLPDKNPPEGIFRVGECMRLSQEPFKGPVDAAYIFGRAEGDWEATEGDPGLLKVVSEYYQQGKVPRIAISGLGTGHGYPGAEVWSGALLDLDVKQEDIFVSEGKGWHTRTEADDLVRLAREQGWKNVLIFAYPHQALRIMLSLVAAMKDLGYEFSVRMVCPEPSWDKEVYGSQGTKKLPRKEHILEEWERIEKYRGPEYHALASFQELYHYLMRTKG